MSFYCAGNGFPTNSQISKERKRFRAKPLPPNRPRALTLPLENHDGAQDKIDRAQQHILSKIIQKIKAPQSQTSAQKQSPLIIRLPYEIRMVIWRYLLCDQRLHLVRAPKRLLGFGVMETSLMVTVTTPVGGFQLFACALVRERLVITRA